MERLHWSVFIFPPIDSAASSAHLPPRMKNLLVAALIAAVSVPAGSASAADANLTALLRGVKEVHGPGSPGGVSVFGSQAFAVVVDRSGKVSLPVIGAAQAGRGRVVAFGHSGYLSAEAFTKADTGALLTNAVVWAGRATKPVVVTHRAEEVAAALTQRGFTVRKGGLKELAGAQVLVLGSLALSDAEAATVRQFVNSGGGLLAAATGWGLGGWCGPVPCRARPRRTATRRTSNRRR
jgi:hypothetical protein